ncbi:MAG: TonB-dependent receptor, partial [Burkholderiaceae bacterium]
QTRQVYNRAESNILTPDLGVVYDFTKNLSAYASYTSIFNPQWARDQAGRLLDPEEGKTYELGMKGAWFDNRLNAAVAVFENRRNNLAVADGGKTPEGGDSFAPVDNTKGRGWEAEISGELVPGWSLQAGYSHAVVRDSDGERLQTVLPESTFKLFTTWTPRSFNKLTVGGGMFWRSKAYPDWTEGAMTDGMTIKAYSVVNLMARYRIDRHLSLAVNLNNLFDRDYRVSLSEHDYGSPRALRATLRYQF